MRLSGCRLYQFDNRTRCVPVFPIVQEPRTDVRLPKQFEWVEADEIGNFNESGQGSCSNFVHRRTPTAWTQSVEGPPWGEGGSGWAFVRGMVVGGGRVKLLKTLKE